MNCTQNSLTRQIILPQVMKLLICEIYSVSLLGCTTLFLSTALHFYYFVSNKRVPTLTCAIFTLQYVVDFLSFFAVP